MLIILIFQQWQVVHHSPDFDRSSRHWLCNCKTNDIVMVRDIIYNSDYFIDFHPIRFHTDSSYQIVRIDNIQIKMYKNF